MTRPGERDSRDLRDRLRELRVEPPDGGFGAALHRRLTAEAPPRAPSLWRRLWPSPSPGFEWRLLWRKAAETHRIRAFSQIAEDCVRQDGMFLL